MGNLDKITGHLPLELPMVIEELVPTMIKPDLNKLLSFCFRLTSISSKFVRRWFFAPAPVLPFSDKDGRARVPCRPGKRSISKSLDDLLMQGYLESLVSLQRSTDKRTLSYLYTSLYRYFPHMKWCMLAEEIHSAATTSHCRLDNVFTG